MERKKMPAKPKNSETQQYPESITPVRHSELPPTNIKRFKPDHINTGASSPQGGRLVWKDGAWQGGFWFLSLFAVVGLTFTLVGFQSPVEIIAVAGGGAGFALFLFLALLVRKHGREHIRIGVDWSTNALWVVRGGRTNFLPHANCIRTLQIQKEGHGRGPGAVAIGENVLLTGGGANVTYRLVAEYSSGENKTCPGTEFQKKREARGILRVGRTLLDSQA